MTQSFQTLLPSQLRKLVVEKELLTEAQSQAMRKLQLLQVLTDAEALLSKVGAEEYVEEVVEEDELVDVQSEEDEEPIFQEDESEDPDLELKETPQVDHRTKSDKVRDIIREYFEIEREFTSGHIMKRYESDYNDKIHRSFVTTLIQKERARYEG